VHPLQTEAVTYVVQRAESLMSLFYLLTLYCFIRYSEAQPPLVPARRYSPAGGIWALLSVLSCFLGMATKEVMVSAPLVVLFYDRTFLAGSLRTAWARRRGLYIGLGASWLLLAILVAGTHGRGGTAGFKDLQVVWPYALTQCRAIVHYLRLSFWPTGLIFDYGTALTHRIGDVLPQVLLLALLATGAGYAWHRGSAVGFAAVSFFALIAPSSSFVPIVTEPMAEHRMYLPLAAVSILFTTAVFFILSRLLPNFKRITLCALGTTAAVGLGLATVRRNLDYGSEIALWSETVRLEPENPRAHNNLAEAYRSAGSPGRAASEFQAAVQADPNYAPAQYNLGVTLLDSGRAAEAIAHLDRALSAPRHLAELNLYLGEAFERTGRNAEAVERYREALRLAPEAVEAAFGLGNNLAVLGRYSEAIEAYRRAVILAPDRGEIRNNLANALGLQGRVDEAIVE
jgi:Flp pilus assembly protein TadD